MHITPPAFSSPPAHTSPENTPPQSNAVKETNAAASKAPVSGDEPSRGKSAESPAHQAKALLDSSAASNGAKINFGKIVSAIVRDLDPAEFLPATETDFTSAGDGEGNGTVEGQPPEDTDSPA